MSVEIRFASPDDFLRLSALARQTFIETFIHGFKIPYDPKELDDHLNKNCSPEYFSEATAQGDSIWVACRNDEIIAYAKTGKLALPVESPIVPSSEIHRVYVSQKCKGQGVGKLLMEKISDSDLLKGSKAIYLGVWENNFPAQRFYGLYGFKPVGEYLYYVGKHADRELILCKIR